MGSSGSGRFSDYPGTGSGSSGSGTGSGGTDRCALAVDASLEDIEQSDFFKSNGTPPSVGTALRIEQRKRLVAITDKGEVVGNIPTQLNYLAACIASGWKYEGRVRASSSGPPVATVDADFAASSP